MRIGDARLDYLVDTNVILRWSHGEDETCVQARSAVSILADEGAEMYVTPQNLVEFWNAATRPLDRNGFGLKPAEVDGILARVEEFLLLADNTPAIYPTWRRLVVEAGASGVQVHDARLAACMLVHGIPRILTFNTSDFARYSGITPVHPRDSA